ncbi:hypothetical protein ACJJTC_012017 [Scirpophaga incertulas]
MLSALQMIENGKSIRSTAKNLIIPYPTLRCFAKNKKIMVIIFHSFPTRFFNNLEELLKRQPRFSDGTRIFNLDETGTTTVQKPQKVVAPAGAKVGKVTSGEKGTLVTTCCMAGPRSNKRKGRKLGKSIIATDTPEKERIAEERTAALNRKEPDMANLNLNGIKMILPPPSVTGTKHLMKYSFNVNLSLLNMA